MNPNVACIVHTAPNPTIIRYIIRVWTTETFLFDRDLDSETGIAWSHRTLSSSPLESALHSAQSASPWLRILLFLALEYDLPKDSLLLWFVSTPLKILTLEQRIWFLMQGKPLAELHYFPAVLKSKPGMLRAQDLPSWRPLWSMHLGDQHISDENTNQHLGRQPCSSSKQRYPQKPVKTQIKERKPVLWHLGGKC